MIYKIITILVHRVYATKAKLLISLILLLVLQPAQASFTDNLTIGNAKALSLGHAVTADPPGIDSIHFNPAGLVRLKGRQMHVKGVYGTFKTEYELGEYGDYQQGLIDQLTELAWTDEDGNIKPGADEYFYDEALNSKSTVEGPTVMLPGGMVDLPFSGGVMGGASYSPPGTNYTFATNVYAPMMSGYHRADDDPGRFFQQRGAFTLLTYFSPSIGVVRRPNRTTSPSSEAPALPLPAIPHTLWHYNSRWVPENCT